MFDYIAGVLIICICIFDCYIYRRFKGEIKELKNENDRLKRNEKLILSYLRELEEGKNAKTSR